VKSNRPLLVLLSLNGGFVDTAGFLALQGLFTAHVTGNFVTIAAALVFGTSGLLTKLLALPVFCLVVLISRLVFTTNPDALERMMSIKVILLIVGAAGAILFGPFASGDGAGAMVTGLSLVAAMAVQNAGQRIHLGTMPPGTLMTGTTTQLMLDVADGYRTLSPDEEVARIVRMRRMSVAVVSFAGGAALAAVLFRWLSVWCFSVAPVIAIAARFAARHPPEPTVAPSAVQR
jgi:uncharacterized membrane protein YoaK (UPF0700 family)